MTSSGNTQQGELSIQKWNIKSDYVKTCNCDFGCPCNFDGFPTYGFCRSLVFFHIQEGDFGNVQLDKNAFYSVVEFNGP